MKSTHIPPWELQQFLFDREPTRAALRSYRATGETLYRCYVYRNHSFELVEHTMGAYSEWAGLGRVAFRYSDYDDSLSFAQAEDADMILLWVDCTRYMSKDAAAEFVRERAAQLRRQRREPILLVTCGASVCVPGVICWDMAELQHDLGGAFFDERLEAYSGTKLSAAACTAAARELGCFYFPAVLRVPLKGIVLDLDNTLYRGVLAEDGAAGLQLTPAHRALQEYLVSLAGQGFFLALATKNDARDVDELWAARPDFPLRREIFCRIMAGWDEKARSIAAIAAYLNIGTDSLVLMDDNPGELAAAAAELPLLHLLLARPDAAATLRALHYFPGLRKTNIEQEDTLRTRDAQARARRDAMRRTMSTEEYLRSLDIVLDFYVNDTARISRISELARKTNQFIFSYARYSPEQVQELMHGDRTAIVSVHMRDKLSDSGCIAVFAGRHVPQGVELEECFVSCRALGRGLDEVIVSGGIRELISALGGDARLHIQFRRGERNEPAARFVEQNLSAHLRHFAPFSFTHPYPFISTRTHHA